MLNHVSKLNLFYGNFTDLNREKRFQNFKYVETTEFPNRTYISIFRYCLSLNTTNINENNLNISGRLR